MKYIIKRLFFVVGLAGFCLMACNKKMANQFYGLGSAPVLKTSSTTISPAAADSTSPVFTLSWTNPKYSTDSANQKFIIELDSTGKNFANEASVEVDGPLSYAFTGNHLDSIMAAFGYNTVRAYSIDLRVTSSYANNNEQHTSNVVTVTITPFTIPITLTPSSSAPLTLQISNATGNAISFNWNASPYGSDTISYAIQLDTVGGNFSSPQTVDYGTLIGSTFIVNDLNSAAIAAGVIGGSTKNVEFRIVSYIGSGYTTPLAFSNVIVINLTTYTAAPGFLYIVGSATAGGWNNPVPTPSQQFTQINAVSFGLITTLTAGQSYLFLPVNGSWNAKYGGSTDGTAAGGGTLLANGAVPGSNTPAPASTGLYQIIVNFQTNTYTVTPFTGTPVPDSLFIVGSATAGQWNNPVPDPSQAFTQVTNAEFQITIALTSSQSYLFLPVNGSWNNKYGGSTDGTAAGGTSLLYDGAVPGSNTPAPAATGNYLIDVNFITNMFTVTPAP